MLVVGADFAVDGERPSSSDAAVMREARPGTTHAEEDHAQGVAHMPQSSNAPTSLSMRHSVGGQARTAQPAPSTASSAQPGPGISQQEAGGGFLPQKLHLAAGYGKSEIGHSASACQQLISAI